MSQTHQGVRTRQDFPVPGARIPLTIERTKDVLANNLIYRVYRKDMPNQKVGYAKLSGDGKSVMDVVIAQEFQRQGIASALYDFIERDQHITLRPSPMWQSPQGKAFWAARQSPSVTEDLRDWFGKGKQGGVGGGGWDRYNTKGERIGKCAAPERGAQEGKPKCLSKQKAAQLRAKGGKQAIANAVKRKKTQDPITDRPGTGNVPKYVSNRIKESLSEAPVLGPAFRNTWNKISQWLAAAPQMAKDKLKKAANEAKRILQTETRETRELLSTVRKLLNNQPVSPQEKKEATEQFIDILKITGLGALYGATIAVPFSAEMILVTANLVKRYLGVQILPSAMNEDLDRWFELKEQEHDEEQARVFTFEFEETLHEKNIPTKPQLWSRAKAEAKKRFDVYPSAYANGWAAKWYKERGGRWRTKKTESNTPHDREWGTTSLVDIYKHDTPGQMDEFFGIQYHDVDAKLVRDYKRDTPGQTNESAIDATEIVTLIFESLNSSKN